MKSMKSVLALACAALLILTGCGSTSGASAGSAAVSGEGGTGGETLSVVSTIFPAYDWTRQILGGHADAAQLTWLTEGGTDLHSYQPTAEDILKISTCDVFIYVGGESDEWAEDALREKANADMTVIKLLEMPGSTVLTEEIADGMQAGEEEEEEGALDEHVWLSLSNAQVCCEAIAGALAAADPANAADYAANAETYTAQLADLDAAYADAVAAARLDTVLFADRFPFRYLTEAYGLTYYAAFAGCSAETQASFETVIFLAQKLDELDLPCVLTMEHADDEIAASVIRNSENEERPIYSMHSLQGVTAEELAGGLTYLSAMTQNLEVLKKALA